MGPLEKRFWRQVFKILLSQLTNVRLNISDLETACVHFVAHDFSSRLRSNGTCLIPEQSTTVDIFRWDVEKMYFHYNCHCFIYFLLLYLCSKLPSTLYGIVHHLFQSRFIRIRGHPKLLVNCWFAFRQIWLCNVLFLSFTRWFKHCKTPSENDFLFNPSLVDEPNLIGICCHPCMGGKTVSKLRLIF